MLVYPFAAAAVLLAWRKGSTTQPQAPRAAFASLIVSASVCAGVMFASSEWKRAAGSGGEHNVMARVMLLGAYQFRTEPWDWRHWDDTVRTGSRDYAMYAAALQELRAESRRTGTPVARLEFSRAAGMIRQEPLAWLRAAIVKALAANVFLVHSRTPANFRLFYWQGEAPYVLVHVIINFAQLLSIALSLRFLLAGRTQSSALWGLWAPWLALLAFTAVTYSEPRYMFPATACLAIMAGVTLAGLLEKRLSEVCTVARIDPQATS
jgi:hypothetical protein